MVILQAIQDFGNWFWGIPILILIGGGGLFLTIYLGFPQIRHFGYAMSQTFGKMFAKKEEGKVRPISAAFAALACAVGASNIVGVPVAIALGGPGAVFWIWILAIFGMCTKYCEVAMGIKYRRKNDVGEWVGGPAYYLRGLGKKIGVVFGVGYAFFFMIELVPSLASQGVSAAEQFNVFGANQTVTGIIIAVLVGVILAGGFKRHRHPGARDGLPVRAGRSGHHLRPCGRAPRYFWHDLPGCLHRPRRCGRLRRRHRHGCYPLGRCPRRVLQ